MSDKTLYRDSYGTTFGSLSEMAEYRVRVKAAPISDTECPAAEYLFSVSHDGGATWDKPDWPTIDSLTGHVARQDDCCLNLAENCQTAYYTWEHEIP